MYNPDGPVGSRLPVRLGGTDASSPEKAATNLEMVTYGQVGLARGPILLDATGIIRKNLLPAGIPDPSLPSLYGPSEVIITTTTRFKITNFDTFTQYTISAVGGTVTREGEELVFVAGSSPLMGSLTVNGVEYGIEVIKEVVETPAIISFPSSSIQPISTTVTLVASEFQSNLPGSSHINTDWQIATTSDFSTIKAQSLADVTNKVSWALSTLVPNEQYYIRVRYRGNFFGISEWSPVTELRMMNNVISHRAIGAGGGGGGAASGSSSTFGGGGGSGGYSEDSGQIIEEATYVVNVGVGGNGGQVGTYGTDGGETKITSNGFLCSAQGGKSGGPQGVPGAGGNGSTQNGQQGGIYLGPNTGGNGGGSFWTSLTGQASAGGGGRNTGGDGNHGGGGGGGGGSNNGGDRWPGGKGGNGTGIIEFEASYPKAASYTGATYSLTNGKHRYVFDADGSLTMSIAIPKAPTITSPANNATNLGPDVTIATSAFIGPTGDSHASTDWEISTSATFATIAKSSYADATSKLSWTAGGLAANTTYYARVRYNGLVYKPSAWSTAVSFKTLNMFAPAAPTITSPANNATNLGPDVTITTSAFIGPTGDSHASTDWELSTSPTFATIAKSSYSDLANKTSWSIAGLSANTTYYIRTRHNGVTYGLSAWSATNAFTTLVSFAPATPSIVGFNGRIVWIDTDTGWMTVLRTEFNHTWTGSVFSGPPGVTHQSTEWETYPGGDYFPGGDRFVAGSMVPYSGLTANNQLNFTTYTDWGLRPETVTVKARVRYKGSNGFYSEWSPWREDQIRR